MHNLIRTCVGCSEKRPKDELIRVVKTPEGPIEIDLEKRKPGRGAYLCPSIQCARQAFKRRGLDRSFRSKVPDEIYSELEEELSKVDLKLAIKTASVVTALEGRFGIPQCKGGGDHLGSLIRTILSQNTNDRNRDRAYTRLRERFPTWEKVLEASTEEIADAIKPGGLANQKSVRIKEILSWIKKNYGELNLDFLCEMEPQQAIDVFCKLKGIGIKTISVVLLFACGVDIFPVDTHVYRICRRLGLVPESATAEKTYWLMQDLVPPGKSYSLHLNLLKLGRSICKPKNPQCGQCPILGYCEFASGLET